MNYSQALCPIIQKETLAKGIFSLWLHCPPMAKAAQPGQFAHLRVNGCSLRRPISICEVNREAGSLRLVFEVRGEGTRILSELPSGANADLIAPLGSGFTADPSKRLLLVGGGIGVPPLLELAKAQSGNATAILGFRSAYTVILTEDFQKTGAEVVLCTDDGTAGQKGFVTAPLEKLLRQGSYDRIAACGPAAMLKGIVGLAEQYSLPCEVSMEERMGCGVGACLVCACKCVKDGREFYAHVCKDGPVFDAKEIVLE